MRMIALVDGMQAVHCVRAIQTALMMVPGVTRHDVTIGRVELEHDGRASEALLRDAVAVAGYAVREVRAERRLPVVGEP